MAASPVQLLPRSYSKRNEPVSVPTLAERHTLPWSPLRLQSVAPPASLSRSVPVVAPYMWYWNATLAMPRPVHAEPSYASVYRSPATRGLDVSAK